MRSVNLGRLGEGLQFLDELFVQASQFTGVEELSVGSGGRVLHARGQLPHQRLRVQGSERDLRGLLGAPAQEAIEIRSCGRQPRLVRMRMAGP
ncbi:hypothetical protein ABT174_35085 [Streptomyces sparsogenes]|uniref:hypothetical protein n=1 Tax=Streptomyces sparsogenes TaxID=67365 RepID=UPI00331BDF98